jgi:hypothetical protein
MFLNKRFVLLLVEELMASIWFTKRVDIEVTAEQGAKPLITTV